MQRNFFSLFCALLLWWTGTPSASAQSALRDQVATRVQDDLANLQALYQHLHAQPELSFHEEQTAARVADELKRAGWEVTPKVGGHGVVAVLRNGSGPTLLVRTDLDALPVKEQTGVPYASRVRVKDDQGNDVDVMHACGHDIHLTVWVGTARLLAKLRDPWQGTLVFIAQPAEERGSGARAMLADGLFTRFPKPDFGLALHVDSSKPAGTLSFVEGFACANVDSVNVTFRGVGGHGAYPHKTKDPVVLAAQAVLAFQTIVSRETEPGQAAVVTVGSIHGGAKHNIIPDEVKLQLTLRSYTDEVRAHTLDAVRRIARGLAEAAGMPADRMPIVEVLDEHTPALYNEPALTHRVSAAVGAWLGSDRLLPGRPVMGGEDFSEFGRTTEKIPICLMGLGAVAPARYAESQRGGPPLPSLHSSQFAPVPEATIKTGVTAMTAAILELAGKPK